MVAKAEAAKGRLELSHLKLSAADLTALAAMMAHNSELTMPRALEKRKVWRNGPEPPNPLQLDRLQTQTIHIPSHITAGRCPPWLEDVCRYRNSFESAVLTFQPAGPGAEPLWFSFLYACQSPFYAMFLPLERLPRQSPPGAQVLRGSMHGCGSTGSTCAGSRATTWLIQTCLGVSQTCCECSQNVVMQATLSCPMPHPLPGRSGWTWRRKGGSSQRGGHTRGIRLSQAMTPKSIPPRADLPLVGRH